MLFTVMGGNFSAQDSDLEFFFYLKNKNLQVSSDYQKSIGNRINAALEFILILIILFLLVISDTYSAVI